MFTSIGTGLAPQYITAKAEAIFVLEETKTSSPFLRPITLHAKCKAVVPLVVVTPYLQFTYLLNFFQKFLQISLSNLELSKHERAYFFSRLSILMSKTG